MKPTKYLLPMMAADLLEHCLRQLLLRSIFLVDCRAPLHLLWARSMLVLLLEHEPRVRSFGEAASNKCRDGSASICPRSSIVVEGFAEVAMASS